MNSYLGPLLFTFEGRINRAKYWIAAIVYTSMMIAVAGFGFFSGFSMLFLILTAIIFIAMIISGIAIGIKRLHDRDKSGWWLLVFYLVPPLLDSVGRTTGVSLIFGTLSLAVSIWMIVEPGFLRGTSGPNRYGPDPVAAQ
ncbi:MAG TPA: DUF805 domain-containing protein [Pseudolabrys sp.]|jgi:uncharacterized membrane protein YhaH (DUF805 family)